MASRVFAMKSRLNALIELDGFEPVQQFEDLLTFW